MNHKLKIWLIRIGLLLAVALLAFAAFRLAANILKDPAQKEAEKVLKLIGEANVSSSYKRLGEDITTYTSREEWAAFVSKLSGRAKNFDLVDKKEHSQDEISYAFESRVGERTYSFVIRVKKIDGKWMTSYIAPNLGEYDRGSLHSDDEEVQNEND